MTTAKSASHVRAQVASQLDDAGVPSAHTDATWLVAEVLGVTPAHLPLVAAPDPAQLRRLYEWVDRRCRREPLQHILGKAPFAALELAVGPGVFVPRPETEVLVDQASRYSTGLTSPPVIVDLCAGSGAIALALAMGVPNASVYAVELSEAALPWLHRNVDAYRAQCAAHGSTVAVIAADATGDPLPHLSGTVDLVATNPPYIPDDCVPRDPEVAQFDPATALYGGADGLDVVRGVVETATRLLRPGGYLLIEHGEMQGWDGSASVPQIVRDSRAYEDVADLVDLVGRPRVTVGRRNQSAV
jgi:release factor glutamine methyltransferase